MGDLFGYVLCFANFAPQNCGILSILVFNTSRIINNAIEERTFYTERAKSHGLRNVRIFL